MRRHILLLIAIITLAAPASACAQSFDDLDGVAAQSADEARHLAVIAQLRIALGDASPEEARSRFAEDFKRIGTLTEAVVRAQLSDLAGRYADRIENAVTGGVRWPEDRTPNQYRTLAIIKLAILREEAQKAIEAGASPLTALEAMDLLLAWSGGNAEPAGTGAFAGVDDTLEGTEQIYGGIAKPTRASTEKGDAEPYEANTERKGGDFTAFELMNADPGLCEFECLQDDRCKAWSYVNPGRDAAGAACWLKSSVPPPVSDTCCTSGIKSEQSVK